MHNARNQVFYTVMLVIDETHMSNIAHCAGAGSHKARQPAPAHRDCRPHRLPRVRATAKADQDLCVAPRVMMPEHLAVSAGI